MIDEEERELRALQMKADIANKNADTALKAEQLRWEPWKALSAAFGAGIAVASALIGVAAWVLSHVDHVPTAPAPGIPAIVQKP